jgi:hypothetical protein
VEASFTALVNGIDTVLTDVATFVFASGTIAKADLVNTFSSRIAAAEKTKAARLALHNAVAEEAKIAAAVAPYRVDMRNYLIMRYGKGSPMLQTFGFTQAKVPQVGAVVRANAVTSARHTREAIGTKGRKQRKLAAKALKQTPPQPAAPATAPVPVQPASPVPTKPGAVS